MLAFPFFYLRRCAPPRAPPALPVPPGAYGSTKRYKSFERPSKVNDACVVGASGELSDFQYIMRFAAGVCMVVRVLIRRIDTLQACRHCCPISLLIAGCGGVLGLGPAAPQRCTAAEATAPLVQSIFSFTARFAMSCTYHDKLSHDCSLCIPLRSLLEELSDDDFCMDDGHSLKPAEVHAYLCRVLYNRRNKCALPWCWCRGCWAF